MSSYRRVAVFVSAVVFPAMASSCCPARPAEHPQPARQLVSETSTSTVPVAEQDSGAELMSSPPTDSASTSDKSPPCAHLAELWDFSQPAESARRFADAAKQSAASGDVACELEALTQLARAEGLQRRFEEAHETLDQVDGRLKGLNDARPALRSKLERGRVFNTAKEVDRARDLFVETWQLAQHLGEDALAVDAAHMVAIANLSNPDKALEWNLKGLKLAESSQAEDARDWLGSLYNNIGWTYFDKGKHEQALDLFRRAVTFRETQGKLKPLLIAKWCVARALRALHKTQEALHAQEQLRQEYETNDLEPTGFVYEELAECKLELRQPGHRELFAKAHAILSKDTWLVENEPQRLERLLRLSKEE